MKPAARPRTQRRAMRVQLGVAAVELALLLFPTIVLLPAVVLFGRIFYQYSIMKGATQDAASYMASLSATALRDVDERKRAIAVAQQIVSNAALEGGMMKATKVYAAVVVCDGSECAETNPNNLDVSVTFSLHGAMFTELTGKWLDKATRTRTIIATSTMPFSK